MFHRLLVLNGTDANREHQLNFEEGPVVFGRSQAQANFALPDASVSRVHFQIENRSGKIWVVDVGSSSGTLVNGRKVHEHELKQGDIIRAGETQLKFFPAGADASMSGAQEATRLEELTGKEFAHFKVGPLLARGTSGCVFKATDTETNQPIALKILHPEMANSEDEMQRFVRAMKTMLPLQHPNLITIYGAGRKGPNCWVSMEFIPGESVAKLIDKIGKEGKLDWKLALRVAVHVSRALEFAEQHQFIHRNISPSNIMVRTPDYHALLGDLMLAKALEGNLAKQITKPGELVGDVHYMSPERTKSGGEVDVRSDIYSLGTTVYALLTGRPPHEGITLVETLKKLRGAAPEAPKTAQPKMSAEFDAAVMKMLATLPEKRFQNAAELRSELERIAKGNLVGI